MIKNKITFKTTDVNDKEISLDVRKPTSKAQMEADKVFNRTFMQALTSESLLRSQIQKIMKDRNLWDDDKQKELDDVDAEILKGENTLKAGGIKRSEGRKIAIQLRKNRNMRSFLMSRYNELDNLSCESQAENRKFDCLVALSTLNSETGDLFFKDLDDYDNRKEEKAAIDAASNMAFLAYGVDPDYLKNFTENKFLKDQGFCDDEYRLIDSQGRLCDEDYRLVDKDGKYINEEGAFVDKDGNLVGEDGSPVVEFTEFLDD